MRYFVRSSHTDLINHRHLYEIGRVLGSDSILRGWSYLRQPAAKLYLARLAAANEKVLILDGVVIPYKLEMSVEQRRND